MVPALKRSALTGALMYYDAQADDARHTLTVARTAATYGATVLNSAEVVELDHAGERIVGARVRDVETGDEVDVKASVVVNCTGVWTDDIQTLAGGRGRFHVRASKGVHIVVPRDRINSETGMILRTEKSVLFVIPWNTHWIVGTTDTDWTLHKAHPAASRADIDYILEHVNAVLVDAADARRHPGRLRRAAAAAVGRERVDVVAVARARRRPAAARADLDRRRQVHHLPGDGRGRDRRRTRGRRRRACRRASPSTSRWSAPRATTRWSTRSTGSRSRVGLPRLADAAAARPLRLDDRRADGAGRGRPDAARAARRCGGVPAGRDRVRRQPRGRARTSTTSSPGVPASRSRRPTAAPSPPRRPPTWSRRSSAGTRSGSSNEVESYAARVEAERRSQQQDDDLAADAARIAAPDTRAVAVGRALD